MRNNVKKICNVIRKSFVPEKLKTPYIKLNCKLVK